MPVDQDRVAADLDRPVGAVLGVDGRCAPHLAHRGSAQHLPSTVQRPKSGRDLLLGLLLSAAPRPDELLMIVLRAKIQCSVVHSLPTLRCAPDAVDHARARHDLGYLLHKNPARVHQTSVAGGIAHVFYPEAGEQRCTAALLLEVDPIGLVRGAKGPSTEAFSLGQYVNDRPYAASSLLAVALGKVFASARRGASKERPELADVPLPLEVRVPALSCRGGVEMAKRFFEPLGWRVHAAPIALDDAFPEWGESRYLDLHLTGTVRVADAINHVYVALPVLDDAKHYWVSTDEIDKLMRAGGGWLAAHPERELIIRRYLAHKGSLARQAMVRLAEVDDADPDALDDGETCEASGHDAADLDAAADKPVPLAVQRHGAVLAALRSAGARRVVDFGCGPGALLPTLLSEPAFTEIVGVDVSHRALEQAARRLRLDRLRSGSGRG